MKLKKAVDLMHTGSLLMKMNKSGDMTAWYLVPGGEVDQDTAEALQQMKDVIPGNDGLFPGVSQTWKVG